MIGLKPVDYDSQETTINLLAADSFATIYTCERSMLLKLDKLAKANPDEVKQTWTDGYAVKYQVPKNWVKVTPPRKLNLTDEQKQLAAARLSAARIAKISPELPTE